MTKQTDFSNPRLEWHMRFTCPECGEEHNSQQDWRRHLNEKHNYLRRTVKDLDFIEIDERYHECQICHKWVANAHQAIALLQYHRFLHLPFSRTYSCRHCTAAFPRKRALCEHLYKVHSAIINRMDKLRKAEAAAELAALKNPKENPEFYMRFICPQCGKQIDRFQQWLYHLDCHYATSTDLHMHNIKGTNNNYCEQCKKMFYTNSKPKLQRHRFEHLPYKLYFQCAFCTTKKSYKSDLLRHFIRCHPKQFNSARPYVRKPIEWAADISDRLQQELDMLLQKAQTNKENKLLNDQKKPTDLIQRALLNSRIDLENEIDNDENDGGSNPKQKELDELCSAVFEKLEAEATETTTDILPSTTKKKDFHKDQLVAIEINPLNEQKEPPRKRFKANENSRLKSKKSFSAKNSLCSYQKIDPEIFNKGLEEFMYFLCPECGIQFGKLSEWRKHVFKAHDFANIVDKHFHQLDDGSGYLCTDCMEIQYSIKQTDLQRHRFRHMNYQHYLKCSRCGECKSNKNKMIEHLKKIHIDLCSTLRTKLLDLPQNTKIITETYNKNGTKSTNGHKIIRKYNIRENQQLLMHLRDARSRINNYMIGLYMTNEAF